MAANMNQVVLEGRLTRDPDVRYSQGENPMAIARSSLAVNRPKAKGQTEETADFISLVAFRGTAEIFEKYNITPDIHFTTLDDYVIMSMVENGLGISILPRLILQRNPYKITAKRLEVATYRNIGLAYRNKKSLSLAVKKFLEYIE